MTAVTSEPTPVVVVAGGSGLIGRAVVGRLLDDGVRVVVPTRGDPSGVPTGARVVPGVDWADPRGLRAVLAEPGWLPTGAVAALGGWWIGPQLVDLDPEQWRSILDSHLTAHFLAVRALAPLLRGPDPAYVLLGGAAATVPMPGSGPINVTGAGQRMLARVLAAEPIGARVRFVEVAVLAAVVGDARNLDPVAEVGLDTVASAVVRALRDPRSGPLVEVR